MRVLDRVFHFWRAAVVRPWIPRGARVLDIGCHRGEFLRSLGDRIGPSVGLDPAAPPQDNPRYSLVAEPFRAPAPFPDASFDVVVMLATLDSVRDKDPLASECFRLLRPGGRLVITLPSPWVDALAAALRRFRRAAGPSPDGQRGFDPRTAPRLFARHGFVLETWRWFQLGLSHLLVFRKPLPAAADPPQAHAVRTLRESLAHA
jgi:SAM-dependent methyltransferase